MNVAHLLLGRWTITMHRISLAVHIFASIVLLWMAIGDPFVPIDWVSATVRCLLGLTGLATLAAAGQTFRRAGGERV